MKLSVVELEVVHVLVQAREPLPPAAIAAAVAAYGVTLSAEQARRVCTKLERAGVLITTRLPGDKPGARWLRNWVLAERNGLLADGHGYATATRVALKLADERRWDSSRFRRAVAAGSGRVHADRP